MIIERKWINFGLAIIAIIVGIMLVIR